MSRISQSFAGRWELSGWGNATRIIVAYSVDEAAGISLEQDADCRSCIKPLSRNALAATLRAILYQAQMGTSVVDGCRGV